MCKYYTDLKDLPVQCNLEVMILIVFMGSRGQVISTLKFNYPKLLSNALLFYYCLIVAMTADLVMTGGQLPSHALPRGRKRRIVQSIVHDSSQSSSMHAYSGVSELQEWVSRGEDVVVIATFCKQVGHSPNVLRKHNIVYMYMFILYIVHMYIHI